MKQSREKLLERFTTEVQKIFEAHPILQEICWTQYTPYFNDGSPCVFEVRGSSINGHDSWEFTVENRKRSGFTPAEEKEVKALEPVFAAVVSLRDFFSEKDYHLLFGDHAEVFVTKGSIRVESYDHE